MLGVTRFEDLNIYKLAVDLRRDVFQLTSDGAVAKDFKFVSQIRDAARGAPRNIAEGFTRFAPAEFRQFLCYAKASIDETKSHVDDAHECGYFTDDDRDRLHTLVRRTIGGINRLMRYLESPAAQRAYAEIRKSRREEPEPENPRT